jgi:Zn-dependent protease with chaperone function
MQTVTAIYYDGHSARQQAVTLNIADGHLEIHGDGLIHKVPLSQLSLSAKLGNTPRLLHFSGGGHCEVRNHADFEILLKNAGMQPQSWLWRIEQSWQYALSATLLAVVFVIATFYWGLPWLANIAAARIPASVALTIDIRVLDTFDSGLMQASHLSDARQQQLMQRFTGLRKPGTLPPLQLKFRNSKNIGANAFALPGGTIVVTDQLVALAGNDEEILAVLAHELGHVSERHPLRQILQSSVVGLAMTWYLGDISSLLAAAPTVLLETGYSRNFERRADQYSAKMLLLNDIPPTRLADILQKLESSHSGKNTKQDSPSRLAELFSSHPDTAERIRELRNYTAP